MENRLIINGGVDAFNVYGVFVVENGYCDLVSYPALKRIATNNWAEHDGVEPDLSSMVLDSRSLKIDFVVVGAAEGNIKLFTDFLKENVYNDFYFRDIGYRCRLRLSGQSAVRTYNDLSFFTLDFADDFPLRDYTYIPPIGFGKTQSLALSYSHLEFGEEVTVKRDFSEYGVMLIDETFNNLNKMGDVKSRLTRDIASCGGVIYDGESAVRLASRDLTLDCLMVEKSNSDFWRNYNALISDLVRSGGNVITYQSVDYHCYYASSSVTDFVSDDKGVWCKFSVNFKLFKQ